MNLYINVNVFTRKFKYSISCACGRLLCPISCTRGRNQVRFRIQGEALRFRVLVVDYWSILPNHIYKVNQVSYIVYKRCGYFVHFMYTSSSTVSDFVCMFKILTFNRGSSKPEAVFTKGLRLFCDFAYDLRCATSQSYCW